jgi:hypothetical protein
LVFSQFVTLFLTPVVYIYMEEATQWTTRVFRRRHRVKSDEIVPTHGSIPSTRPGLHG